MTNAQLYAENLTKVMAHLRAEFSNDIEQIMETVAPDPRFAILTRESGNLDLEIAEAPEAVRAHYRNLRASLDVVQSRQIRRLAGDWFVFQQSVATMRTRSGSDGLGSPHEFPIDTAVLFPIAPTGIRGEIPWNRSSFADAMTAQYRHHEPPTEELMPTVDLFEGFLAAWRSCDEKNVVDLLEDDCAVAIRSYTDPEGPLCAATGKDAVQAALAEQFKVWRPESATTLNLVVTDWYVFSNVRWIGESRSPSGSWSTHEISTATILPISEDRRFRAVLGYGTSPEPV
jgi:hypothetical protein